jgi:hypothetical protein
MTAPWFDVVAFFVVQVVDEGEPVEGPDAAWRDLRELPEGEAFQLRDALRREGAPARVVRRWR